MPILWSVSDGSPIWIPHQIDAADAVQSGSFTETMPAAYQAPAFDQDTYTSAVAIIESIRLGANADATVASNAASILYTYGELS